MVIRVPIKLFKPNPYDGSGASLAHFYLLHNKALGISKSPIEVWKDRSLMYGMMPYRLGKRDIIFDIPSNIMNFYAIGGNNYTVSLAGYIGSFLVEPN